MAKAPTKSQASELSAQKKRLATLRGEADETLNGFAAKYGIHYQTYKKAAAGERRLQPDDALTIANFHGVAPQWVLYGFGKPEDQFAVPLRGYVHAGQAIVFFEDTQESEPDVDAVIASPDCIALEIRGSSMLPLARNGDIAFFERPTPMVSSLIGSECAVVLRNGERYFKILERGSGAGLYDLRSYNEETMRDVIVKEAGAFVGIKRTQTTPARRRK